MQNWRNCNQSAPCPISSTARPMASRFRCRTGSLFDQLGLQDGDMLTEINGHPVTNPMQAMGLMQAVQTASSIDVTSRAAASGQPGTSGSALNNGSTRRHRQASVTKCSTCSSLWHNDREFFARYNHNDPEFSRRTMPGRARRRRAGFHRADFRSPDKPRWHSGSDGRNRLGLHPRRIIGTNASPQR